MEKFSMWLLRELEKQEMNPADLAKKAGLDQGTLGNILNGNRGAGPKVCIAIAAALGERPEKVFREAGLLPPSSGEMDDLTEEEAELVKLYRAIPPGLPRRLFFGFVKGAAQQTLTQNHYEE